MKPILFSGVKPTGEIHIGNYLGALKNWVALQDKYQAIYSIVDYHALTVLPASDELRANTFHLAVDLLSIGIDPKASILFRQSDVPMHTELAWIFSCLTPVPELLRMTQYKDLVRAQKKPANAGMLTYPVLQAADILLYKASHVPVGDDQLQHLELARVIGRKFNQRYGEYFPEVKPVLSENVRVMSLHDPEKKMSKSLGPKSYIALRDKPEVVRNKIAKAVTDSLDNATTLTGGHNLLMLYKNFGTRRQFEQFERAYELKSLSYAQLKRELADALVKFIEPVQKKQDYYEKHPKEIERILALGGERANQIARKNIAEIRKLVGL